MFLDYVVVLAIYVSFSALVQCFFTCCVFYLRLLRLVKSLLLNAPTIPYAFSNHKIIIIITLLARSPRLLSIASENSYYLILHNFKLQGVFGPPEPKIPLKTNTVLARLVCKVIVQSRHAQISTNGVKRVV